MILVSYEFPKNTPTSPSPLPDSRTKLTFHPHPPNLPDHRQDPLEPPLPPLQTPPSGTHTEPRGSVGFGLFSLLDDRVELY